MLKRKMFAQLLTWSKEKRKKVLLLLGARQTGKTYIVRHFARSHYEDFIEVNFLEGEENAHFLASASGAEDLVSRLSLIAGHSIKPGTLVFLDEVQQAGRNIVTLSKFLLDDGRFDLILSGSLLGTALKGVTSFPVGYAKILHMYPLDFEEFCWANAVPEAILDQIREAYRQKVPLEQTLHQRLIELYRRYIAVGGMPEAVQEFVDAQYGLGAARSVDTDIIEQYRYDIIKYAQNNKPTILSIFNNIPSQLAQETKRFKMSSVTLDANDAPNARESNRAERTKGGKEGSRTKEAKNVPHQSLIKGGAFKRLEDDFTWLIQAGVALPAYLVREAKFPLLRTEQPNKFKLYSSDCGLLLSQYPVRSSMDIISGAGDANFGSVYENVVAQEIVSAGYRLFYYHNNRKGEVDFLLETKDEKILPIEVKSGKNYKRHMALNNLLGAEKHAHADIAAVRGQASKKSAGRLANSVKRSANPDNAIECAYVLSEQNVSVESRAEKPVYYLPLYMTMCLGEEKGTEEFDAIELESIPF